MTRMYGWILVAVSLAVMLHFAISYYDFTKGDAAIEYQVYSAIVGGEPISFNAPNLLVSCLTTTYLPALIQRVTHIESTLLFRYYAVPLMIWLPLVVYWLALRFLHPFEAFCVGLLYIAQPYFVVAPMVSRIVIANTLFVLSVLMVLQRNIRLPWKVILLGIIVGAMVVTAYSVTFLAVAFYVGWLLVGFGYGFVKRSIWKTLVPIAILVLFVVGASGIWLHFITWLPWQLAIEITIDVFGGAAAQNGMTSVAVGQTFWYMNNAQRVDFLLTWLVMGLISLGLLVGFRRLSVGHAAAIAGYGLLTAGILFPALDAYFGIQRIYFCVSAFLLIFLVYGIRWLAKLTRVSPCLSLSVATGAYFVVGSGLLYYMMGYDRFVH